MALSLYCSCVAALGAAVPPDRHAETCGEILPGWLAGPVAVVAADDQTVLSLWSVEAAARPIDRSIGRCAWLEEQIEWLVYRVRLGLGTKGAGEDFN